MYQVEIKVDGYLSDTTVDLLWDCVVSKRAFVELSTKKGGKRKSKVDPAEKCHLTERSGRVIAVTVADGVFMYII